MAAYQAGNADAFAELFDRYGGSVYGFFVRRLPDRRSAEDLFQETFLRLHRGRNAYDGRRPFRAWLFGIVHHLLLDQLRDHRRWSRTESLDDRVEIGCESARAAAAPELASEAPCPESQASVRERTAALTTALRALSPDEGTVLLLARLEGLSYSEIANVIGRSTAATKQLAYRALRRVRAEMAAAGHGDAS
jgi:RNA polymerase sigma-70 factor (ECF subfamily)